MIITCPDCGGKIPDTETQCPICGALLDSYSVAPSPCVTEEIPEREVVKPPKRSLIRIFFRRIFELIVFLLICAIVLLVVLATDFLGSRTALRQMCMTDSGSGSQADHQVLRVEVKHYILQGLNLLDRGGAPNVEIQKHNKIVVKKNPVVKKKKKREPLRLPPDPPEVQEYKGVLPGVVSESALLEQGNSEE